MSAIDLRRASLLILWTLKKSVELTKQTIEYFRDSSFEFTNKDEQPPEIETIPEYCPEYIKIFELGKDTVLGIERIERTPDETAIVRILTKDSVSKPYKRKVSKERRTYRKFISVDNKKLYLD